MYLIPYNKIEKGEKLAIYGYGQVGRNILMQLSSMGIADRVCAVFDRDSDYIVDCPVPLFSSEEVSSVNFDRILIAVDPRNEGLVSEVHRYLFARGVDENKVVPVIWKNHEKYEEPYQVKGIEDEVLHIGFSCVAGMGDAITDLYLAAAIKEKLKECCRITYITAYSQLFEGHPAIDDVATSISDRHFDILFQNMDITIIKYWCPDKIKAISELIYAFCKRSIEFNSSGWRIPDYLYTLTYSTLFRKKKYTISDPFDYLGITDDNRPTFPEESFESEVLIKYGLEKGKYILFNRDVDKEQGMNHPKLWPIEYYGRLIELLKCKYKDLVCVQVGARGEDNSLPVDIDLSGRTKLKEIKAILRNAKFLISSEGGLVHLMHLLGGRSVVIYGPTDERFFSYDSDLACVNRKDICEVPCNYVFKDYTSGCLKGFNPPKCMENLTPEFVYKKIESSYWM